MLSSSPNSSSSNNSSSSSQQQQQSTKKPVLQSLTLSSIQPIHDVHLQAVSVKTTTKSLVITEKDPGVLLAGKLYTLVLSWYRSETTYICQNEISHQHEERPVATLQCMCCKRSFCGKQCFLHPWHHQKHRTEEPLNDKDSDKYETYQAIQCEPKNLRTYIPTKDDIGRVLRVKAQLFDQSGVVPLSKPVFVETKPVSRFPNPPPQRFLIPYNNPRPGSFQFTVMSYNVLAEMYASKQMVPHCPSHWLDFNFRRRTLVREILSHRPDVLCLQEVQADHYDTFWYPELQQHGYNGLFKKKTKDVFTGAGKYSMDGCATFYRTGLFDLVSSENIEFRDLAMQRLQVHKNQNLTRMIKDNVALVLFLRPKARGFYPQGVNEPIFCVGNTHIMANPQYTDVKIWQVYAYLQELYHLTKQGSIPLVLAGDFNSTPDSGAYHLIVNNQVPSNHPDLQTKHSIQDMHWKHDLKLQSAYGEYNQKSEPLYTTKTPLFTGTLDYLFYTPRSVGLLSLLSLPELAPEEMMPSEKNPSDHVALMGKFELRLPY
eukprot:CAMPEP_0117440882 /NCGR_PEP_ID=MMETSP0759-20121206/3328_1 /TAXON_ID=63605 /ORGANISM="Percolomonas cosmopolitus, Strain WS" /LENGTH=541 /DNA_ID=CAMNT_0005232679 /DNA_START=6369 /DNA_END=7994 /DNA_ORIENTATION=-